MRALQTWLRFAKTAAKPSGRSTGAIENQAAFEPDAAPHADVAETAADHHALDFKI